MPALTSIIIGVAAAASVGGAALNYAGAQKAGEANEQIARDQQQQNVVQQQAAEADARRKQLEVVRNAQVARSTALTNATTQNAQLGSGLQGGYGQISGEQGNNILGINQNLQFGQQYAAINADISEQRIRVAQAGSQSALGQGLSSLGGTILSSAGAIRSLSGGFGGGFSGPNYGASSTSYNPITSDYSRYSR